MAIYSYGELPEVRVDEEAFVGTVRGGECGIGFSPILKRSSATVSLFIPALWDAIDQDSWRPPADLAFHVRFIGTYLNDGNAIADQRDKRDASKLLLPRFDF